MSSGYAQMLWSGSGTGSFSGLTAPSWFNWSSLADQSSVRYRAVDALGNEEVGRGVWTSATATLTRATVITSTNNGAKVNFPGAAVVMLTDENAPASAGLTVGTTTISGGTNGSIEYNNGGVLGELATTGTGSVALIAGSLTISTGKTFTVDNTITLQGTDSTTFTLPAASDTLAALGTAQTFTKQQTIAGTVSGNPALLVAPSSGSGSAPVVSIQTPSTSITPLQTRDPSGNTTFQVTPAGGAYFATTDTNSTNISLAFIFSHVVSAGGGVGCGMGFELEASNSVGIVRVQVQVASSWIVPTSGSQQARYQVFVYYRISSKAEAIRCDALLSGEVLVGLNGPCDPNGEATLCVNGDTIGGHFGGNTNSGTSPTVAAGPGAGSSGTATLSGTDTNWVLTVVTDGSPGSSSIVATITFGTPFTASNTVMQANNAATAAATPNVYTTDSGSSVTINTGSTALAASTTYQWTGITLGN